VQDHGKLAGHRHGGFLGADASGQGPAPGLQIAWRADRLKMTFAASNSRPRTMLSPRLETRPARSTSPD
jgi:hypothetical protein